MSAVTPPPGLAAIEGAARHESARVDASKSPEVPSDWGTKGEFILVRPLLNGRDVGWFIFDTGASGCTITAEAAAKAGLPAIGTTRIQGQFDTVVYRCDSLQVGPMTLEGLNMAGLDMHHSSMAFGHQVAGILGRNVCSSAIVELDGPAREVRLIDPDTPPPIADVASSSKGAVWIPIEMQRGLPWLRCTYGSGAVGLFVLDTGANATVHFLGSAVERHQLTHASGVTLNGRRRQITFGATTPIDVGTIDSFMIGGRQFGPLAAAFAEPGDAPSRVLSEGDGMIGMGFMKHFVVTLDEPRERVSFADPSTGPSRDDGR